MSRIMTTITGRVIERSQSVMAPDGVYYQFIKIDSDDGDIYHVPYVMVGADNDMDVTSGEVCTFYIRRVRNLATSFTKKHVILASQGDRGVSVAKSRLFWPSAIAWLARGVLLCPLLFGIGYLIASLLIAPVFGQGGIFWILPFGLVFLYLHVVWTYLSLGGEAKALQAKLTQGSKHSQTLPTGRKVRTL